MNGQQEEGKDASSMMKGTIYSDEDGSPNRQMVSQNSMFRNDINLSSEDSLEKSFKETELASDDEEASM